MESTNRTCRWVSQRLPLLAGGDLAGLERRRVERHLIGCSTCRDRRSAASASLAVLRGVAALGPMGAGIGSMGETPSIWPALARQIREAKHQPERLTVGEWVRSWLAPPALAWVGSGLTAAALGLGLGWSWLGNRGDQTASFAPVATVTAPPSSATLGSPRPQSTGFRAGESSSQAFDPSSARAVPRYSALPGDLVTRDPATSKPPVDPFAAPTPLRLDYDLDWWTLSGTLGDTQRAY